MTDFEINPDILSEFITDLSPRLERATGEMAKALDQNLARGERSGRKYPQLPYRSSAPGEFSQEQHGDMRDGVYHDKTADPLAREVGIRGVNQKILNAHEFGYEEGGMAKRANIARTVESEDVQAAALESMKGE